MTLNGAQPREPIPQAWAWGVAAALTLPPTLWAFWQYASRWPIYDVIFCGGSESPWPGYWALAFGALSVIAALAYGGSRLGMKVTRPAIFAVSCAVAGFWFHGLSITDSEVGMLKCVPDFNWGIEP